MINNSGGRVQFLRVLQMEINNSRLTLAEA